MSAEPISDAALDRATWALHRQSLSWLNFEGHLSYNQARVLARLALEAAAQESDPQMLILSYEQARVLARIALEAADRYANEKLIRRRRFWLLIDLLKGQMSWRECVDCGRKHWNSSTVALPICAPCVRNGAFDRRH